MARTITGISTTKDNYREATLAEKEAYDLEMESMNLDK